MKHFNLDHAVVYDRPEPHVDLAPLGIHVFRIMRYTSDINQRVSGISFRRQALNPKGHPTAMLPSDLVIKPSNAIPHGLQEDSADERREIQVKGRWLRPARPTYF